jgi:hypothetical protein
MIRNFPTWLQDRNKFWKYSIHIIQPGTLLR